MLFRLKIFSHTGEPYRGSILLSATESLSERYDYMVNRGQGIYEYRGDLFQEGEILEIYAKNAKVVQVKNNDSVHLEFLRSSRTCHVSSFHIWE